MIKQTKICYYASQEKATSKKITESHRPFLLITLAHAETRNVTQKDIINKLLSCFSCTAIAVAKEAHQDKGFHFHAAIECKDASRYNAKKKKKSDIP